MYVYIGYNYIYIYIICVYNYSIYICIYIYILYTYIRQESTRDSLKTASSGFLLVPQPPPVKGDNFTNRKDSH